MSRDVKKLENQVLLPNAQFPASPYDKTEKPGPAYFR